ncbi:MAG TPA: 4-hydroxy-tetrahydrodipicolinate synthase [Jiangellales bacterium]|nr:4-hydroxy-tetrahydrodipicolinate synthase [Jiangellales bacterium]
MPDAPRTSPDRPFGTVLTAMVTPFDHDGRLDPVAAAKLAAHLVDHGHDGLVVSGTTGESPTTSDAEKVQLLRAVLEAVGDRAQVLAGVGTNDTAHTVQAARQAEAAGAHGLLVVTPYYSKPPQSGLLAHFTTVAEATGLPVMVYDIPGRSAVRLARETLLRLAGHERIRAVKDATGDLVAGSELIASSGLAYYSGDDALNLGWLAHGAAGVVSVVGHLAGERYAAMAAAVDAGDLAEARRLHLSLLPAVRAVMSPRSQGAVMVKAALHAAGLLPTRRTRLPLPEATDDEVRDLVAALAEAGLR